MQRRRSLSIWLALCIVALAGLFVSQQALAGTQPIFLPIVQGGASGTAIPPSGAPLPPEFLGEKLPVAGATAFFKDQWFNSTGDLSIWAPPNANPVRGILVMNGAPVRPNPADPDWRNQVAQNTQLAARQLASTWGFAYVSGAIWTEANRSSYDQQEALLHGAIDEFAKATGRTELRNAPLVLHGFSRFVGFLGEYSRRHPERVIAYAAIVMANPGYSPGVPGLVVVGETDSGPAKVAGTMSDRAKGALVAPAMIWGEGHICNRCGDLIWPFMDYMVRLRLPANADPRAGPVALKPIAESDGWLGDVNNWSTIAPYTQYSGDKRAAAWFPNKAMAMLWRNFMLKQPPATFTWPTQPYSWSNGFTQQPAPLFGRNTRDLSASRPLDITAKLNQPISGAVHFYDGDVDLGTGTVSSDGKQIQLKGVSLQPGVHAFTAVGENGQPLAWPAGLVLLK